MPRVYVQTVEVLAIGCASCSVYNFLQVVQGELKRNTKCIQTNQATVGGVPQF